MMPCAGYAEAYLVLTYVVTSSGEIAVDGSTVCFDLGLALEMAEADGAAVAGASVFALDERSEIAGTQPIAAFGVCAPARRTPCDTSAKDAKSLRLNALRLS